jgi:hypothetical protein
VVDMAARPRPFHSGSRGCEGGRGKGEKRKKKGGEVATDRWGRTVSGTGAGCAGQRVGWAERRRWADWLAAAHLRRLRFFHLIHSYFLYNSNLNFQFNFESTQINSNKIQLLTLTFLSPKIYRLK